MSFCFFFFLFKEFQILTIWSLALVWNIQLMSPHHRDKDSSLEIWSDSREDLPKTLSWRQRGERRTTFMGNKSPLAVIVFILTVVNEVHRMWSPPIWNNFSVQDNSINANIPPFLSLWISWLKESHVMSTGLFLNIAPLSAACVCVCACVLHMPLEFLTSFLRRETGRFLYIWFQFFQSWSTLLSLPIELR